MAIDRKQLPGNTDVLQQMVLDLIAQLDAEQARRIKTAEDTGGVTVVTDGLQSGERVVTTNQYRLQAGAHVRSTAAAAAAGGAQAAAKAS